MGAPTDRFELEADRMQSAMAGAGERASAPERGSRGPEVADIPSLGEGAPLPSPVRAAFERRFDHDFSGVRVHTDERAGATAHRLRARAFTVGSDIAFSRGEYSPATREGLGLLAHELTHVVQQSRTGRRVQRQVVADKHAEGSTAAGHQRPIGGCGPNDARFTVTAPRKMSGRELLVEAVIVGEQVAPDRAGQMVETGVVTCAHPRCKAGLAAGESVEVCYPRAPAPRLSALVQGALDSFLVTRFIRTGTEKQLLKLLDRYWPGDSDAILSLYHTLLTLKPEDLDCYWRWVAGGGVPEGWMNIAGSLAQFTEVRERFCNPVELAQSDYQLLGRESLYALIVETERLEREMLRRRYDRFAEATAAARGEPPADVLATKLEAARTARDAALRDAGFASVDAFLETSNDFRVRFRARAVAVLTHALDAADRVVLDALSRYAIEETPASQNLRHRVSKGGQELYDEVRAARSKDAVIAAHPILAAPGVWDEISRARNVYEFTWRIRGFAAQRSVDLEFVKRHVDRDPDVVFKFDPIVKATKDLFAVADDSIFDLVIRDQIGKPGPAWWQQVIDIGLLLLSFVPGPIGFGARLVNAARNVGGEAVEYGQQLRAYEVGVRPERPSARGILYAGAQELVPQAAVGIVGKGYRALKGAREAAALTEAVGGDVARAESSTARAATGGEATAGQTAVAPPSGEPSLREPEVTTTGTPTPTPPPSPPEPPLTHAEPPVTHEPPVTPAEPPVTPAEPAPPAETPHAEPAPPPTASVPPLPAPTSPPISPTIGAAAQRVEDTRAALAAASGDLAKARAAVDVAEGEVKAARELVSETSGSAESKRLLADTEKTLKDAKRQVAKQARSEAIAQRELHAATAASQRITQLEDEIAALDQEITNELHPRGGFSDAEKWAGRRPGIPPRPYEPGYQKWSRLEARRSEALRELTSEEGGLRKTLAEQVERATPGAARQEDALVNARALDEPLRPVGDVPIDVMTGRPISGPWAVDHIMSRAEIARDSRFARLSPWQRDEILLEVRENYLPLTAAANSSKGSKPVTQWLADLEREGTQIPEEIAAALREADERARKAIEDKFQEFLKE